MRDRFVVGLKDRKLKERLQLAHDLTLTKSLEIARQDEQVKRQMRVHNNQVSNVADELRKKSRYRAVTTQVGRGTTGQSKQSSD